MQGYKTMRKSLSLSEAALEYARSGFQIAPLWPKSKDPLRGFSNDQPSSDEEMIRYWWKRCSEANIGIPTGIQYNSLVVLDLDINLKEEINGEATLKSIMKKEGIVLPRTAISKTGSGGKHIFYKLTAEMKVSTTKGLKSGIDIISEGAHVVAPPSVHKCGRQYEWIEGDISSITVADDNVIRLIKSIQEYG